MSLQAQIKEEIKKAMLAKDSVRLNVVRGITTACTNELVAKGKKPQDELADEDTLAVIKRLVKQRRDSIEQFEKGGRADLAADEKAELAILEAYLPQSMLKEDIKKIAEKKIAEMGADKSKMGVLIGAIMKETKGQADGGDVKAVVEELLK